MTHALTSRQADALGVLFAAEIKAALSNGGPSRARKLPAPVARQLAARGLVVEDSETIPFMGRLTMTVTGYRLTPAGHLAYCAWAAEQTTGEDEP